MSIAFVLLAARGQGDPAITAISTLFILVLAVILILRELTVHYDVVTKSGVPYCPRCNRQVTYRRDHCRSCGYGFKTYWMPTPAHDPDKAHRDAARQRAARQAREEYHRLRAEKAAAREAARVARRAERDAAYREKGIEPGPWAWFKVLPDVPQALLMGAAFAIPAAVLLIIVLRIGGHR